jgi:hypothetical protein
MKGAGGGADEGSFRSAYSPERGTYVAQNEADSVWRGSQAQCAKWYQSLLPYNQHTHSSLPYHYRYLAGIFVPNLTRKFGGCFSSLSGIGFVPFGDAWHLRCPYPNVSYDFEEYKDISLHCNNLSFRAGHRR